MNLLFSKIQYILGVLLVLVIGLLLFIGIAVMQPVTLSESVRVDIPEGSSLRKVSEILDAYGLVHHQYQILVLNKISPISVKSGSYQFDAGSYEVQEVITRFETADYGDVYVPAVIPEGSTIEQIISILESHSEYESFDAETFRVLAQDKEGYLYPDTYFFLPDTTTEDMYKLMTKTFSEKFAELKKQYVSETTQSDEDIVIMASIIEREATGDLEEQQIVSGILWKRIFQGIPLQVDAPFVYAIGKGSAELRTVDLQADGPYNTYTRLGLPPTPIGNPGSLALEAAMTPQESPYYFYLHDNTGKIHYGVTHDDHVRNKNAYLR
tara:strand:+ start:124 stop:1095 length:972 start_codon:yes stop_codon:yes gene_type:complete